MLLCGLLLSQPGSAREPAPEYQACLKQAFSTMDTLACMSGELRRVDALLNRHYREAMDRIHPFRRSDLRQVQRAWIRYRDARCGFFNHRESGSGGRLDEMQCLIDETARRARELAEVY